MTPADATVAVYRDAAMTQQVADLSHVPYGTYFYTVSKNGYVTKEGSFGVAFQDVVLDITLSEAVNVPVSLTPSGAALVVKDANGGVVTAIADGSYTLIKNGYYTYTASADGYLTENGSFTATSGMTLNIALTSSAGVTIIPTGDYTITSGGGYALEDGYAGIITVDTTEPVTLIGTGTGSAYHDVSVECAVAGVNLTIKDLYILQETGSRNMFNFQGANNTLNVEGVGLLEKDTGATGYAMIHVPDSAELTISGGTLYMYKSEQGAGIGGNGGATGGGQTPETNGKINIVNATIFGKNSKQGALVGAGANAGTQTPKPINIINSDLTLIAVSRAAAIGGSAGSGGASAGSTVTVTNSRVTVNVDFSGSAIGDGGYDGGNDSDGGTLIYNSGSVRAFIDENAKGAWNVDEAGVNGNKSITANIVRADGAPLYMLELDTADISGDTFEVREGNTVIYSGPRHQYAYVNEALPKDSQIPINNTMDNWTALDDTDLYLYVTGEDHSLTVNGAKYTAIWNAASESFIVTEDTSPTVMLGDVDGNGKVTSWDVTLVRRFIVGIITSF